MTMNKSGLLVLIAFLAIVGLAGFLMANTDPVGAAITQTQIGVAAAPVAASVSSGQDLLIQVFVIAASIVGFFGLGAFVYKKIKSQRSSSKRWAAGPNANFALVQPVKRPSLVELLTLLLSRQLIGDRQPQMRTMPDERRKAEF